MFSLVTMFAIVVTLSFGFFQRFLLKPKGPILGDICFIEPTARRVLSLKAPRNQKSHSFLLLAPPFKKLHARTLELANCDVTKGNLSIALRGRSHHPQPVVLSALSDGPTCHTFNSKCLAGCCKQRAKRIYRAK